MATKMDYALAAAGVFVHHLHREGFDRGMIATFGDNFRVEQGFTARESSLHATLARIKRSSTDGSTRLYDSMEDGINEFWRTGARNRPWVLTVITDGHDNASYRNNATKIGRYVWERFNREPSNFPFLIGVGEGNQIDKHALATVGNNGRFPALTIAAFPLLEMLFLNIAVQVSTMLSGRRIVTRNMTWQQVAQLRRTSHTPIDYAFLIDRSGSMTGQA